MPSSIDTASPGRAIGSRWLAGFIASLRENSPVLALFALFLAVADGTAALLGETHRALDRVVPAYGGYLALSFVCFCAFFILWTLHITLIRKVSVQTGAFWRLLFTEFLSRERILLALPILALWPVMVLSFSLMKTLIPAIAPFHLDPFLHAADRWIHFGQDPWTLLHPLLGHPGLTYVIDRLYALWMFVMYLALLAQITSTGNRRLRMHFLLSSMLTWVLLGSGAATLLSSAGPCYYEQVVGAPVYGPLMAYLRETVQATPLFGFAAPPELIAVRVQDMLWSYYQQSDPDLGGGISAAPSLHVASTWLIARLLQTYGRWPAVAGWSFFSVILIGSVHLGWHYALDGYMSILGAWVLWRFTGWLLDLRTVQALLWRKPRGPIMTGD